MDELLSEFKVLLSKIKDLKPTECRDLLESIIAISDEALKEVYESIEEEQEAEKRDDY